MNTIFRGGPRGERRFLILECWLDAVVAAQFFVDHAAVLDYSARKLWLKK